MGLDKPFEATPLKNARDSSASAVSADTLSAQSRALEAFVEGDVTEDDNEVVVES